MKNILLKGLFVSASIIFITSSASAMACTSLTKALSKGSENSEVLKLQQFLFDGGYLTAKPNGYFGDRTVMAVKKFQKEKGLAQVGTVGPLTRTKLKNMSCSSASSKDEVKQVSKENLNISTQKTFVITGQNLKIQATPSSVNAGESSVISWTSSANSGCYAKSVNGKDLDWMGTSVYNGKANGNATVFPKTTSDYSIFCSSSDGQAEGGTVTVSVAGTAPYVPPAPVNLYCNYVFDKSIYNQNITNGEDVMGNGVFPFVIVTNDSNKDYAKVCSESFPKNVITGTNKDGEGYAGCGYYLDISNMQQYMVFRSEIKTSQKNKCLRTLQLDMSKAVFQDFKIETRSW